MMTNYESSQVRNKRLWVIKKTTNKNDTSVKTVKFISLARSLDHHLRSRAKKKLKAIKQNGSKRKEIDKKKR